jgi:hypothetical protein
MYAKFLTACILFVQGPEQNLLKELALSREQLKRDLTAARQELELVAGAAAAAKEEAAVEVNMLRRQLQEAQAQAAEASQVGVTSRGVCVFVCVCSGGGDAGCAVRGQWVLHTDAPGATRGALESTGVVELS